MTEPCDLSAVAARRLIGQKKLSPVELTKSCLQRIEKTNPTHNAIVALDQKRARADAKAAEQAVMGGEPPGLLPGVPGGIKDLHLARGLKGTWGSLLFKDNRATEDDSLVANVRAEGALVFAMTNTPEFGAGANTRNRVYGATGNPFDPKLTPAGSSGGSACALALGQLPLATGSDYAGSLRTPAAFCGVVGFRPSPGLVPAPEKQAGLVPWGVVGPMGRSVEDAYLLLRAQLDHDENDPFSSDDVWSFPDTLVPADLSAIRIAFTPDFGVCPVDKGIARVFRKRMQRIAKLVGDIAEESPDMTGLHEVFDVHRGLAFVTAHQEKVATKRDLLDRNVIANTEQGLKLSVSEIGQAFVGQHDLMKKFNHFFEDFDVLIAPAAAVSPFPHEELFVTEINGEKMPNYTRWMALAYAPTTSLCCALALPCGVDEKGLPFGIQVIGRRGADLAVLEIGLALETAFAADETMRRAVPPVVA